MTDFAAATVALSASDAQPSPDTPGFVGGVPLGADGQVLSWLSSIPTPVDPKNLAVVTPYGAAARVIGVRAGEWRPLLDLPAAKNDGSLIDVPALESQMAPNVNYHAEDGNYLLSETLVVSTTGTNILSPSKGATFKIVNTAPPRTYNAHQYISPILLGASNTGFQGKVDANRDNQDKTAWNAYAAPGFTVHGYGIEAGDFVTRFADIWIDAKVSNAITAAVYLNSVDRPVLALDAVSCGGVLRTSVCADERLGFLTGRAIAVAGFIQGIQGLILQASSGTTRLAGLTIYDQFGDENPSSAANSVLSGVTMADCDRLILGPISIRARQLTGINAGPAFSLIGNGFIDSELLQAWGYPGQMLELSSSDATFKHIDLDQAYAVPSGTPFGTGVTIYDNSTHEKLNGLQIPQYRDIGAPRRIHFKGGRVQRCGYWAWQLNEVQGLLVENVSTPGNRNGVLIQNKLLTPGFNAFAGRKNNPISDVIFRGCDFSGNIRDNVLMQDGMDVTFDNCKSFDAGQGTTRTVTLPADGQTAVGFNIQASINASPYTKPGLVLINPKAGDDQDWTDGWFSYNPASPLNAVSNVPNRLRPGQTLNVGKASNLTVYRIHVSGTSAGGAAKVTINVRAGLRTAQVGQAWEVDIYAAQISGTANIGASVVELCELNIGGALLAHTDSAGLGGSLALVNVTRTFNQSGVVQAGVKINSSGTISNGASYDVVFDISIAQVYAIGHAISLPNNTNGVVGVIGSGGVLPDGMSITGPSGAMVLEVVSITQNSSFTQFKDIVVNGTTQHDEFDVQQPTDLVNYVNGTGTISTIGTTVTGIGTQFLSEIDGRLFINVDGVVTQMGSVVDNTTALLYAAFPANVTNRPFTMIKHPLSGKPSQTNPVVFNSTEIVDPVILAGRYSGNLAGDTPLVSAVTGSLHTAP